MTIIRTIQDYRVTRRITKPKRIPVDSLLLLGKCVCLSICISRASFNALTYACFISVSALCPYNFQYYIYNISFFLVQFLLLFSCLFSAFLPHIPIFSLSFVSLCMNSNVACKFWRYRSLRYKRDRSTTTISFATWF